MEWSRRGDFQQDKNCNFIWLKQKYFKEVVSDPYIDFRTSAINLYKIFQIVPVEKRLVFVKKKQEGPCKYNLLTVTQVLFTQGLIVLVDAVEDIGEIFNVLCIYVNPPVSTSSSILTVYHTFVNQDRI